MRCCSTCATSCASHRPSGRVLHFAPEPSLQRWVASLDAVVLRLGRPRLAARRRPRRRHEAALRGRLRSTSSSASHVLEHVPDDRKAIAEFFRVAAARRHGGHPGAAPTTSTTTVEDSVASPIPREREQLFGQYDHVRVCGARLPPADRRGAGFDVHAARTTSGGSTRRRAHALRPASRRAVLRLARSRRTVEAAGRAAPSTRDAIRRISVVAPMCNEAAHIEHARRRPRRRRTSTASSSCSSPTAARPTARSSCLRAAAERHGVELTRARQPGPLGLARPQRAASAPRRGDLIVRVDCHSRYPADYLRRCVDGRRGDRRRQRRRHLRRRPAGRRRERAVACAMDSPFGGIRLDAPRGRRARRGRHRALRRLPARGVRARRASSTSRSCATRTTSSTSACGSRAAGSCCDPSIRVYYTPRGSFRRLFRQYYEYGLLEGAGDAQAPSSHERAQPRTGGVFVTSVPLLAALGLCLRPARALLRLEIGAYITGALGFAGCGDPRPARAVAAAAARCGRVRGLPHRPRHRHAGWLGANGA